MTLAGEARRVRTQTLNRMRHRRRVGRLRRAGVVVARDSVDIDGLSRLAPGARVSHHASLRDSTVGPYTSIGRFSKLAFVDLGAFCSIAWDVTLGAVSHPLTHASSHAFPYAPEAGGFVDERSQHVERARLGCDVWVGCNAVVVPSVEIGHGAVIAATAVVTRDVEPYAIVAGVPAQQVGRRFTDEQIARLLDVAWWDWPAPVLRRTTPLFQKPLDEATLEQLEHEAARVGAGSAR
jgi:acetyltransferase-like isoleucine patch superfamily enzyme